MLASILLLGSSAFNPSMLPLRCALARRCAVVASPRVLHTAQLMAGFGSEAAAPKKAKVASKPSGKAASKAANKAARSSGMSAKRQWDQHTELVKSGCATTRVWARPANSQDAAEWVEVGSISAEEASDLGAAAHAQKRLILEHAGRVSPKLLVLKALECGYGDDEGSIVLVAKGPPPEGVTCGLLGLPDAGGFYKRGAADIRTGATLSSGAAPASDSKGRVA
jgi:hypothetical protein